MTDMMHLTTSYATDKIPEVRFYPNRNDSYEVQIFLGTVQQSIYMSAGYARAFAEEILRTVPAPAEVLP